MAPLFQAVMLPRVCGADARHFPCSDRLRGRGLVAMPQGLVWCGRPLGESPNAEGQRAGIKPRRNPVWPLANPGPSGAHGCLGFEDSVELAVR
jgi:hypothetical protein